MQSFCNVKKGKFSHSLNFWRMTRIFRIKIQLSYLFWGLLKEDKGVYTKYEDNKRVKWLPVQFVSACMLSFLVTHISLNGCFENQLWDIKASFCLYFSETMSKKKEQQEMGYVTPHVGMCFFLWVKQVLPAPCAQIYTQPSIVILVMRA